MLSELLEIGHDDALLLLIQGGGSSHAAAALFREQQQQQYQQQQAAAAAAVGPGVHGARRLKHAQPPCYALESVELHVSARFDGMRAPGATSRYGTEPRYF
jgi:hypothetical protein